MSLFPPSQNHSAAATMLTGMYVYTFDAVSGELVSYKVSWGGSVVET